MSFVTLATPDGQVVNAHTARPATVVRAGIVVVQEIFGVNAHIRAVADGYAADGFLAIAPALFDRQKPGIELGYTDADMATGFALKNAAGLDAPLMDIAASVNWLREQGVTKVGVVGYCWGGLLTWLSATRLSGVNAAVTYYGGGMPEYKDEKAKCPVLAHFADDDKWIPAEAIAAFQAAQPSVQTRLYHAHHGFNCDHRGAWEPVSAKLARDRTVAFFRQYLG